MKEVVTQKEKKRENNIFVTSRALLSMTSDVNLGLTYKEKSMQGSDDYPPP